MSTKTRRLNLRPATWKQRLFLQERGIDCPSNTTVTAASELITEYIDQHSDANGFIEENHIGDIDQ